MKTFTQLHQFALRMAAFAMLVGATWACSSTNDTDDPTPEVPPVVPTEVANPTKVKTYGGSENFQTDLDAFVTYAFDIHAFRMGYWMLLSNGFVNEEAFCATIDDIDGDVGSMYAEFLFDVVDHVAENADQYEQALERLSEAGVLEKANQGTRGWIADCLSFGTQCRNTQVMGRKSVVTILNKSGMAKDSRKLQELFNTLPKELRRDYSDAGEFWYDFSRGHLDEKANQVFVNLYTFDPMDFGSAAKELGITPGRNITAAGAALIEKGASVVISALPCSTEVGYGKDIFGTLNATGDLFTKGDVKGFLQQAFNNAINYGPYIEKLINTKEWKGYDLFDADEWDLALALEAVSYTLNDGVFEQNIQEFCDRGEGNLLVPNKVTVVDADGNSNDMVLIVDQNTGQVIVGFSKDENGNLVISPGGPGVKVVTVVNRGTHKRGTKVITVPKDKPTEVEMKLLHDDEVLEENPENGELVMKPTTLAVLPDGGNYKAVIVTNYLYYACKANDDWLSASVARDANYLYVTAGKNDTDKERRGSVTVMATDSKGNVLKSTMLSVVQPVPEKTEYWVSGKPSTLEFDAAGGAQDVVMDHSYALNNIGCTLSDDMAGWADYKWKETSTGWSVTVSVTENKTGKERSGLLTLYAAASKEALQAAMDGNIDPDLAAATTVLIKQKAEEENADFRTDVERVYFKTYNFYGIGSSGNRTNATNYNGFNVASFPNDVSFSNETDKINVTPIGNQGSFKCTAAKEDNFTGRNGSTNSKYTLSFTIDPPENGQYGKAREVELIYSRVTKYEESDYAGLDHATVTAYMKLKLADIPFANVNNDNTGAFWKGKYEDGVKVKELEYSCEVVDKDGQKKVDHHINKYADYNLTSFSLSVYFPEK